MKRKPLPRNERSVSALAFWWQTEGCRAYYRRVMAEIDRAVLKSVNAKTPFLRAARQRVR